MCSFPSLSLPSENTLSPFSVPFLWRGFVETDESDLSFVGKQIGEAFRRFGISETTRDLLVLKVATSPEVTLESVGAHLAANVQGVECAFDDEVFRKVADVDRVRKVYKISSAAGSTRKGAKGVVDPLEISGSNSGSGSGSGSGNSQDIDKLQVQVLGLMALRGAT